MRRISALINPEQILYPCPSFTDSEPIRKEKMLTTGRLVACLQQPTKIWRWPPRAFGGGRWVVRKERWKGRWPRFSSRVEAASVTSLRIYRTETG